MPTFKPAALPKVDLRNAGLEELRAYVMNLQQWAAQMERDQKYYLNNIDTDNIAEVGGWRATPDQLTSKDGDVGLSTEDTASDDVRMWAGSTNKDAAPWRVYESGKMSATGATIESSSGFPKVSFDPDGNLIGAYTDMNNYVAMIPIEGTAPAYAIYSGGVIVGLLQYSLGFLTLITPFGTPIQLAAGGNVDLFSGSGHFVRVENWSYVLNIDAAQTLQQALDAKQNTIIGASGTFDSADGKTVTVSNGIITSIV